MDRRRFRNLILAAVVVCLYAATTSQASSVHKLVGGENLSKVAIERRQDLTTDRDTTDSITTVDDSTSTTTTDEPTTTTQIEEPTTSKTATEFTSTPRATTRDPSPTPTVTSITSTETAPPSTEPITTTRTREVTTVVITISGVVSTSIGFTSEVVTQTPTPTINDGNKGGGGGGGGNGLSTTQRNTIIGVVVGVGGAIIIGGLATVIYRLTKKRSSGAGYGDEMGGTETTNTSGTPQDAFKATLDQYHKPPGTVNPSANF